MDPKKILLFGGGLFAVVFYIALLAGSGYVAYLIILALKKYIGA